MQELGVLVIVVQVGLCIRQTENDGESQPKPYCYEQTFVEK
jgi:hypothetical protein